MKRVLAAFLISVSAMANSAEPTSALIPWNTQACKVILNNLDETQALHYSSIATNTKLLADKYSGKTIDKLYSGKCPFSITKQQPFVFFHIGVSTSHSRVYIFEMINDTLEFRGATQPENILPKR